MTLTESTRQHVIQWRAFVGPPWARADAATFYDWSTLNYGSVYAPVPVATTLATALAHGEDHAHLTTTTNFPAAGGVWVGPVWEYIPYTGVASTQLTGLVRETIDSEQTGDHANGAAVRFWYPLTTATRLTLSEQLDDTLGGLDWQATISGDNAPQAALRNGHLVLIQTRHEVTGDSVWSDWTNLLVGWLQSPQIRQGSDGETPWEATIVSSAGMLQSIQAQGLRVGPVNAARGGSISGTQELVAWYKMASCGEFVGSNIALSAEQAVDGNRSTLYASERYLSSSNKPEDDPTVAHPGSGIAQAHITAYIGQSKGYRWISIYTSELRSKPRVLNSDRRYPELPTLEAKHTVLCENEVNFRAENPEISGDTVVYEIPGTLKVLTHNSGTYNYDDGGTDSGLTVAQWWDSLSPAGGILAFACGDQPYGGVMWGTETAAHLIASHGWTSVPWSGAAVAAPLAGQTLARDWNTAQGTAAAWDVSFVSTPGILQQGDERFYLLLKLNGMGLTLTDDITDAAPGTGDTLYITLGDGGSVDGLDADGTLQIGSEQITYSAKTTANDGVVVTARGANSTTEALHVAGETIYQVEGGLATDTLPLDSIILRRPTGKPVLKDFKLYGARSLQAPRVPDVDPPSDPVDDVTWTQDYELFDTVTSNAFETYTYVAPVGSPAPNRRYRWLLLVVTAISTDPYQLMLNEFEVTVAGDVYTAATYLATGSVHAAVSAILDDCGLPDTARVDGVGTPTVTGYTTAPDFAWSVCADLADMTGCFVSAGRDSKITTDTHPYLAGTPAAAVTWSKTLATSFAPDWPWGRMVSQVELPWLALDGGTGGTVKYPATPDEFGAVLSLEPQRFTGSAAALVAAEKRYWLARLPFGMTIEAAGAPLAARPGVAHGVTWQLDSAMLAMARTYLLDGVTHRLENQTLTTVVHGVQLNREDER